MSESSRTAFGYEKEKDATHSGTTPTSERDGDLCRTILTLISIEVILNSEMGEDEWSNETRSISEGSSTANEGIIADNKDVEVIIGHVVFAEENQSTGT